MLPFLILTALSVVQTESTVLIVEDPKTELNSLSSQIDLPPTSFYTVNGSIEAFNSIFTSEYYTSVSGDNISISATQMFTASSPFTSAETSIYTVASAPEAVYTSSFTTIIEQEDVYLTSSFSDVFTQTQMIENDKMDFDEDGFLVIQPPDDFIPFVDKTPTQVVIVNDEDTFDDLFYDDPDVKEEEIFDLTPQKPTEKPKRRKIYRPKATLPVIEETPALHQFQMEPCPGPNTRRTALGTCECNKGYPFGDASLKEGCWNCSTKCVDNAYCIYPGRCACRDGFFGDGAVKCTVVIPKLLSISPKSGPCEGNTLVNVSYTTETNLRQITPHCRFGGIPVKAENFTETYIMCRTPARSAQSVRVYISLDGIQWSKDNLEFRYYGIFSSIFSLSALFILFVISLPLILYTRKRLLGNRKKTDEAQPFVQHSTEEKKNRRSVIPTSRGDSYL